jgi:hypothetical protein
MDKTRLQILAEVLHLNIEYFSYTNLHADTEQALEAMKIAMKQAFEASRKRIYSETDREVMAKYKTFDEYLNKLEEQK